MDIYLLRHSDAVDQNERGYTRDADRPLTEGGARKMKKIAKAVQEMGVSFDTILSSPYRRAKETAEIVGEVMECRSIIRLTPHLVVGESPTAIIKEINEDYPDSKRLLLVSHEPLLTHLISVLISGRRDASVRLKKGGLCKLAVDELHFGKCATLEWLMGPSQVLD